LREREISDRTHRMEREIEEGREKEQMIVAENAKIVHELNRQCTDAFQQLDSLNLKNRNLEHEVE